jgi:hypothetical protein
MVKIIEFKKIKSIGIILNCKGTIVAIRNREELKQKKLRKKINFLLSEKDQLIDELKKKDETIDFLKGKLLKLI